MGDQQQDVQMKSGGMKQAEIVGRVFEQWAGNDHAEGMERGHWPVVRQAFDLVPDVEGNYLEIGVGNGYGIRHMAEGRFRTGRCVGIDLAAGMVERAAEKVRDLPNATVQQADFMEWNAPDGMSFSLIFSMEVFYYFDDIQKGIDRAVSLLAPGGCLMIMVDFYLENASSHEWPAQLGVPMQLWSMQEYRHGMDRAGLSSVEQRLLAAPSKVADGGDSTLGRTLCTWGRKSLSRHGFF